MLAAVSQRLARPVAGWQQNTQIHLLRAHPHWSQPGAGVESGWRRWLAIAGHNRGWL